MIRTSWAVIWLASAVLAGCGEETSEPNASASPVRVAEVQSASFRRTLEGIGTIEAARRVEIRPDAGGFIEAIRFRRGQTVRAGEVLFVLEADELRQELAAARAQLESTSAELGLARRSYQRYRELFEKKAAAVEEMDQARADYQSLQAKQKKVRADVRLLERRLSDKRVQSPVPGVISDHTVDVGDYVEPGRQLATVLSESAMEIRFTVGQQALGKVRRGQPVRISIDAMPGRTLNGTVSYIAPAVEVGTRQLPIVATVDDPNHLLKPGAFASAELTIETRRNVPSVPEEALVGTREGYQVYVVEDGKARVRQVEVGLRKPGLVEILDGLEIGETVVRTGHLRLQDGQEVRIAESPATAPAETQPAGSDPADTQPAEGAGTATTRDDDRPVDGGGA